jgi:hypothetical protein
MVQGVKASVSGGGGSARGLDPAKSFGQSLVLLAPGCGGTQGFSCTGFGGPVPLSFNVGLHFKSEVGVVFVIVATSTDLEDDTRIAFVSEAEDRPEFRCIGGDMVAARSVAGLAAYAGQIGVGGHQTVLGKATRPAISRGVTGQALRVPGFFLGFQSGDSLCMGLSFHVANSAVWQLSQAFEPT